VSVFVDTSALYAILVGTERDHAPVTAAFKRSLERGQALHTTNYVLVETAALLQHRIGLAPVRDLDERLVPLLSVTWIDADLHRRAMERLVRTDRRRISLVDAASFVVMEREGISDVLGLDSDFPTEGFRLVP
jgi:predicted nucleic acid-binding protein